MDRPKSYSYTTQPTVQEEDIVTTQITQPTVQEEDIVTTQSKCIFIRHFNLYSLAPFFLQPR